MLLFMVNVALSHQFMDNGFIQKQTISASYNDDVYHDDDYKNNMVKDLGSFLCSGLDSADC